VLLDGGETPAIPKKSTGELLDALGAHERAPDTKVNQGHVETSASYVKTSFAAELVLTPGEIAADDVAKAFSPEMWRALRRAT
jgi:hypothetical protein